MRNSFFILFIIFFTYHWQEKSPGMAIQRQMNHLKQNKNKEIATLESTDIAHRTFDSNQR